jgi:hypothetical protein
MASWARETLLQVRQIAQGVVVDTMNASETSQNRDNVRKGQEDMPRRGIPDTKKALLTRAVAAELCVAHAGVGRHSGHAMRLLQLMLCGSH